MSISGQYTEFNWLKEMSLQLISEQEFEIIEKSFVKLRFKKGEVILKQGGLSTHIVYLVNGIVKFSFENEFSKNLILTIVSAPKILGGANMFYKDNNLFSIVAIEECEVILIDSSILMQVMERNARFSLSLFQFTSEMFKNAIMNFISLAYKQKEGRIADIILYLANDVYHSNRFNLSLTRRELAEFVSCSTENVIMTLSRWQNEKIIAIDGKYLEIIDIEKLKHICKIG